MGRDRVICEVSPIYYFLIVVACMNFMSSGSLIFLLLALYELFRRNFIVELDGKSIVIILLSVSIFLVSYAYYDRSECIKAINYALVYILGYDGYFRVTDRRKYVEKTMFSIAFGFGIELILMFLYNYGRERVTVRSMYSIWTGTNIAVTLLGLLTSVVIGYSFYVFFCTKRVALKVSVLLMLITGVWFGFETATRTPLIMLGIVYVVMGIALVLNKQGVRAMGMVFGIGVIAVLLYALYRLDVGGIRTAIMDTPVFSRFEYAGLESGRIDIMQDHFSYMFRYLWGGDQIFRRVGMRAHNFLQEGHDMYGIFATIALAIIAVQAIGNMLKLLMRKEKTGTDFLFLSMYLAIVVQLLLEPVFNGYPILIWSFLMIHGMANAYMKDRNLTENDDFDVQEVEEV